ncbi:putative F-box protein At1g53550 [Trifolium pratense]|uniref:putative F-box protein At1g53550 n=1 Tax=Trifolium pratense TaxID=57577 RepID=UPI001E6915A1|nr:putative F-box protein At1g53550 [Trifolium pratense]XP_045811050.1 putative F-box protein At1g53550 [Trifolium pratense]
MQRKKDSIVSAKATNQRCNEAKGEVEGAESHELCPYFDNLPSHLAANILLQLPIKSLLVCRCVCKIWKTIISEPRFAKLHFERSPFSLMIRTHRFNLVSRTLHLLDCQPETYDFGSKNLVKLDCMTKLPLRDGKLFKEKREKIKNKSMHPFHADTLFFNKYSLGIRDDRRWRYYADCRISHDKFNIINSCNGLLCLSDPSTENPLAICNPVTGEFIRLPKATKAPFKLNTNGVRMKGHSGLGFQPKTNEYKVIKMRIRHVERAKEWVFERVILEVNTLGSPSWRNVEVDPRISILSLEYPTCVNGVFHWIKLDGQQRSILCFCFESERLQPFPSPPHVFENHNNEIHDNRRISMGELKGFIYICDLNFSLVTMWVMNEYGIEESWTKAYNIETSFNSRSYSFSWRHGFCWPVKPFEEGASIFLYHSRNCLIHCEPEKCEPEKYRRKVFQIRGACSALIDVIPHIPSLISLKDVVKGDNIEVLSIHSRYAEYKMSEENEVLFLAKWFTRDLVSKVETA